jgi:dGTPase
MLKWEKLLCSIRRKDLKNGHPSLDIGAGRMEAERDYDRILFAAPTRRLADKTQVFPMEEHDSIRTRLTHSHEVSNLARSIGVRLAFEYAEKVFGENHDGLNVKRVVPSMLAAAGLAHDLGNPPFGHQGEASMQEWFRAKNKMTKEERHKDSGDASKSEGCGEDDFEADFLEFDGNAQTFRLLTRLQVLNDDFGLNLTLGTLASLVKYPTIYGSDKCGYKKFGIFKSEADIIGEVWEYTGLRSGLRHPLALVMEACDDIAYSVIDAEDTVKKGYASFYDMVDFLGTEAKEDDVSKGIVEKVKDVNAGFKKTALSSREINDISMQIFRAIAISKMVDAATKTFVENIDGLLSGQYDPSFELIKASECGIFCSTVKKFDRVHGFRHKEVLKLELKGNNYICGMMEMLSRALEFGEHNDHPFEKFVYGNISENYRRVYENSSKSFYNKRQLICDALSGMTESYLIKKHDEFRSLIYAC